MMQQNRNNMMLKKEFICAIFVLVLATLANAKQGRIKRMFAMCPPHFQRIGRECYFISTEPVNWLDAHFECKDRNSRLAEPYKFEDRLLRKYMQRADKSRTDFWIGGIFNWQRNKWQWGYNGRDMTYQSFSQMSSANTQDLKFHCAILNPHLKYRWSARSCVDKHSYICQHRMPYVNEKNREKVYQKWNETFPNEMANEIEEVVNEDDRLRNARRGNRRPLNRQRNLNERNRHANSIQTRLDDRLENRVDFPRPVDPSRPIRRRQNRHRPSNGNGHKNDVLNNAFEPNNNRSRFYTPRKPIDFGENKEERLQRRREHQKRRRNRLTTTTTTTTIRPTTTTESIPATMRPISADLPTTTTENIDERYRVELAEEEARRQEDEEQRYQARNREKEENMNAMMKQEERRIYEENERRAKHIKEMEERNAQLKIAQEKEAEIERLRREKQRQNEERRLQNEQNQLKYEEEKRKQAELMRQREREAERNSMTTTLTPLLSNDVIQPTTTTSVPPKSSKKLSPEERQRRRDAVRKRFQQLSPQAQQEFLEKKMERSRKRDILAKAIDDAERTK